MIDTNTFQLTDHLSLAIGRDEDTGEMVIILSGEDLPPSVNDIAFGFPPDAAQSTGHLLIGKSKLH